MKIKNFVLAFLAVFLCAAFTFNNQGITVHSIGDSTMATYSQPDNLMRGWMQVINSFFTDNVKFRNNGVSGASTKSYRDRGFWDKAIVNVKPGDYVFIQFGHNDQKASPTIGTNATTTFKENLTNYVTEVKAKGANPILLTSIVRRRFDSNAKVIDSHGEYITVVRKLAVELKVPLIDLHKKSAVLVEEYGVEDSKKLFMFVKAGTTPRYINDLEDNVHLSELGATEIVKLVVTALKENKSPLVEFLK